MQGTRIPSIFHCSRVRCRWVACSIILIWMTAAQAMMTEQRSGKVVEGPGGRYGYERISTFWSDLGEFNSRHLHAGPIELILSDSRTSAPKLTSPASIGVLIGGWSTGMNLEARSLKWPWVALVGVAAVALGWWRRRSREARTTVQNPRGACSGPGEIADPWRGEAGESGS
jgi:hypothetical protein